MLAKAGLDLAKGDVGLGLDQRQDRRGVRLDPTGSSSFEKIGTAGWSPA
jgi:hypothetical protein